MFASTSDFAAMCTQLFTAIQPQMRTLITDVFNNDIKPVIDNSIKTTIDERIDSIDCVVTTNTDNTAKTNEQVAEIPRDLRTGI